MEGEHQITVQEVFISVLRHVYSCLGVFGPVWDFFVLVSIQVRHRPSDCKRQVDNRQPSACRLNVSATIPFVRIYFRKAHFELLY